MFHGDRVSVWEDGKVKMDGGDSHTMRVGLMPLNWTLKTVQMGNFTLFVFYHSKKSKRKRDLASFLWPVRGSPG